MKRILSICLGLLIFINTTVGQIVGGSNSYSRSDNSQTSVVKNHLFGILSVPLGDFGSEDMYNAKVGYGLGYQILAGSGLIKYSSQILLTYNSAKWSFVDYRSEYNYYTHDWYYYYDTYTYNLGFLNTTLLQGISIMSPGNAVSFYGELSTGVSMLAYTGDYSDADMEFSVPIRVGAGVAFNKRINLGLKYMTDVIKFTDDKINCSQLNLTVGLMF